MFPFPIARPQGCDIQTFYGDGGSGATAQKSWNKPPGVSHVYMLLIGGGGNGDGTTGGGSGAITAWYGAAQHVPNNLVITVNKGGDTSTTQVGYRFSDGIYTLLSANPANSQSAGLDTAANQFAASGFYKSMAGQDGSTTIISPSSFTFLSGGGGSSTNNVNANYGYSTPGTSTSVNGFFQMRPIIVGVGGKAAGKGGIGCGGGGTGSGIGGPGMVLIASW